MENLLSFKASSIPPSTNNMDEARALLSGIVIEKKLNFSKVHIERHSSLIINACINKGLHNWKISYTLNQVWKLLESFEECNICHMYKEGNKVADLLANMGCDSINLNSTISCIDIGEFPLLTDIIDLEMIRGI